MRRSTQVALFALDLHVLGTPPAFVLSQDQTLQDGLEVLTGNLPPASFETEESLASVGVCSDKTLIYCEPLQYFLGLLSSFQGANCDFRFNYQRRFFASLRRCVLLLYIACCGLCNFFFSAPLFFVFAVFAAAFTRSPVFRGGGPAIPWLSSAFNNLFRGSC